MSRSGMRRMGALCHRSAEHARWRCRSLAAFNRSSPAHGPLGAFAAAAGSRLLQRVLLKLDTFYTVPGSVGTPSL